MRSPLDWIVDPYAREYGVGRQSAFTLGYVDSAWGPIEEAWKTPALEDLIAYEIMLHEFAPDLPGVPAGSAVPVRVPAHYGRVWVAR